MKETKEKAKVVLSAIDPFLESNLPDSSETKSRGKSYINWGSDNKYPDYLWSLYNDVTTLQSIINGTVDFICGNDIQSTVFPDGIVNKTGETVRTLIKKLAVDKLIFGGFAIQVIRNMVGEVSELYYMDFMRLRSDEKNEVFYYAEDWSKWGCKSLVYPKYKAGDSNPSSVFYNKGHLTRGVYPTPIYGAAVIPCEIEKSINQFHLNNINNGFMSSLIINFNNGQPNDEQKEEIEKNINEKFSGYQNAGRILVSYNDSDENKTTIERLNDDDFDEKYQALADRSRTQIFSSFRATPNLFGDPTSTTGFNTQEYMESFKLYNRTVVKPHQLEIKDAFNQIMSVDDCITITPFSLDE